MGHEYPTKLKQQQQQKQQYIYAYQREDKISKEIEAKFCKF